MKPFSRRPLNLLKILSAFLVCAATYGKTVVDRSVVTVNDDVILESDVEKFQEKVKSKSFQELFGGMDPKQLQTREKVLDLLIEEKLIDQQVKRLELSASDAEVEGQIRAILKRNGIKKEQLTERLRMLGTTFNEYKAAIRRQVERGNLIRSEVRPNIDVTKTQINHYFMRNARPEDLQPQFHIAHILIENKTRGGLTGLQRAEKIAAELAENPALFEVFVKDYSDDSTSTATGGDLGLFSVASLSKEFRDVVPKTTVGQTTKPVKTAAGYHIIKVIETKVGDFESLPKEKQEAIRNQMTGEEVEKRMALWLERKKNEAYIKKSF